MLDRLMRFIGEAWLSFPWDKNKKMRGKKKGETGDGQPS
jgi:hypothetical protein